MGGKKSGHKGGPKTVNKLVQAIGNGAKKGNPIITQKSTSNTVTLTSLEDLGNVFTTIEVAATPKINMPAPTIAAPILVATQALPLSNVPTEVAAPKIHNAPIPAAEFMGYDAPKQIKVEAPVLTAVKMERSRITPPTTTKTATPKKGWGIVLQTVISVDGDKWYTKILTELPNEQGVPEWTTILAYKPAGKMPLYAECEFTIGTYQKRPTATDVEIVSTDTPTKAFFELLTSPEVVAHQTPLKQVYISDLVATFQEATLVGANINEKLKNFLNANGILSVLGMMDDGSLIVQKGRENSNVGRNNSL